MRKLRSREENSSVQRHKTNGRMEVGPRSAVPHIMYQAEAIMEPSEEEWREREGQTEDRIMELGVCPQ